MNNLFKSALFPLLLLSSTYALASGPELNRNLPFENANREVVIKFYELFFNEHNVAEASELVSDNYRQHNPHVPDGKKPFVEFFSDFFKHNPQSHARIVRSATDGDLVWLHVHSTNGEKDRGRSVVDIFKVKNGKITEHWDVIQNVPEKAANDNTMF
ncbi:nuclear transport factor 2 family protein [Pantoea sp. App145]|uniref:nuclear transport factor 2 family protein n=1 Tax=Pantoea sp. App145 TaxID=3071567 RepID=UPI003A805077